MLPELKTFNFIQEWLGMELGTFVMCQISKMHFSHAFPHSWKTLSHKTLLKTTASSTRHGTRSKYLAEKNEPLDQARNSEVLIHWVACHWNQTLFEFTNYQFWSWTSNGARGILPCTKQNSENGILRKSKSTILIAIRICTVVHHPFDTIEPKWSDHEFQN